MVATVICVLAVVIWCLCCVNFSWSGELLFINLKAKVI